MNYTDKNSNDMILRQMNEANIIYVPPFLLPCKNVPSTITNNTVYNTIATTATTSTLIPINRSSIINYTNNKYININNNNNCNYNDSNDNKLNKVLVSSCCQRQKSHKNYEEKHAMPSTTWHNNININSPCNNSQGSSKNARIRRRNFHTNWSLTLKSAVEHENNINNINNNNNNLTTTTANIASNAASTIDVEKRLETTIATIATTATKPTRTIKENNETTIDADISKKCLKFKTSTSTSPTLFLSLISLPITASTKISSSSSSSSSSILPSTTLINDCDLINENVENVEIVENDEKNELTTMASVTATAITINAMRNNINSHLDVSNMLSNSQLVMPIEEYRLENMTVAHERSNYGAITALSATTPTNSNNASLNNSQTTMLDCRCFHEKTSDIYSYVECRKDIEKRRRRRRKNKLSNDINDNYNNDDHHNSNDVKEQRTTKMLQLERLWQEMPLRSQLVKLLSTSRSLLLVFVMLMLTSSVNCWAGRQEGLSNCTFPSRWEGSWFLSGYQQSIHIKGSQFSYRGKCAASDGNKYLIVDEKGCHRCLVIYEKHKNVLQYKESECEGDSMYMHQSNPSALAMRSVINNNGDHRGGAHPNSNGHSRLSSSDQYIMRSNDDMNDCPPDFCKGRETLQNLCDQIPGDALLYSLFRESAEPVKCPLKGPFVFTYNRGHGECKSPASNIESCTEESRLLLSFQACPDVQGTESTVEELTCLATWKDGNSRYLVGLVSHHHAISNEERYRCFVYEKINSMMGGPSLVNSKDAEYKLAQSGDATCNGLDSAEVGSRIMSLRKPPIAERCDFPVWFKGPRHWHALMGNAVYNYHTNDGSIHIIKPNGYMETRALCEQINKQTATEMMAVVHYTTGCQSGFMCMMFYRRDTHVIEIQTGKQASRLEDACAPDHFDINKMSYITLLANNPDPQICPMEGLYNLRGAIGPPYVTTRHKRNHNNKVHSGHGHHHLSDVTNSNGFAHKRHDALSFRTLERAERSSWHASTKGLAVRTRRETLKETTTTTITTAHQKNTAIINENIKNATNNETNIDLVNNALNGNHRNRRDVPACITNYKAQRQLWVGCTEPNVIDVRPLCTIDGDEEYSCHGSWSENSTVYIIARHKGTKHGVCISYHPTEGTSAKLVIGDACYRGTMKPPEHHLVANLSVFGKCGETGSTSSQIPIISWLLILAVATLTTFINQLRSNER